MASSYKFLLLLWGSSLYAARERANGDYAWTCRCSKCRSHYKNIDEKPFLYGKEDYRNPSLLIKRAENLDA